MVTLDCAKAEVLLEMLIMLLLMNDEEEMKDKVFHSILQTLGMFEKEETFLPAQLDRHTWR